MKLTELIEKRIDENVASYDLGTLESYKYLIETIAIEYNNEQLRLYSVVGRSEQLICPHCGKYKSLQGNGMIHQLCECGE
jgi:hypothetical protein